MSLVEQQLELAGDTPPKPEPLDPNESEQLLRLADRLALPELSKGARLEIANQMRKLLSPIEIQETYFVVTNWSSSVSREQVGPVYYKKHLVASIR